MSADDTASADPRAVENGCAHSDKAVFVNRTPMQDRPVPYGAPGSHCQRKAKIGVHNAVILYITAFADMDQLIIAPEHRAEPDACFASKSYLPNEYCVRSYPIVSIGRKFGRDPVETINWHGSYLLAVRQAHMDFMAGSYLKALTSQPRKQSVVR